MIKRAAAHMTGDSFGLEELLACLRKLYPHEYIQALHRFAEQINPFEAFETAIADELLTLSGIVSLREEAEATRLHGPDEGLDQAEIDLRDRWRIDGKENRRTR